MTVASFLARSTVAFLTPLMPSSAFCTCIEQWPHVIPSTLSFSSSPFGLPPNRPIPSPSQILETRLFTVSENELEYIHGRGNRQNGDIKNENTTAPWRWLRPASVYHVAAVAAHDISGV